MSVVQLKICQGKFERTQSWVSKSGDSHGILEDQEPHISFPKGDNTYFAEAIESGGKYFYRIDGYTIEIKKWEYEKVIGNPRLYYFSTALKLHLRIKREKLIPIFIDHKTIAAYLATSYRVESEGQPNINLRIDKLSRPLLKLHKRYNVSESVFVTACNPFGTEITAEFNKQAKQNLESWLDARGIVWLPGAGYDDDAFWSPEPSVLALGVGRQDGLDMCVAFEQNAVVWVGADAVPRLVLHPSATIGRATESMKKESESRKVRIEARWANDDASSDFIISQAKWKKILEGGEYRRNAWARYEGDRFSVEWVFSRSRFSIDGADGG